MWPADISITGIDIKKQANRFHSHWGVPEVPEALGVTLVGFEVTASQGGVQLSQEITDPSEFSIV